MIPTLKSMQDQLALGSQFDPTTAKQVENKPGRLKRQGKCLWYSPDGGGSDDYGQAGQAFQPQRTQKPATA